MKVKEEFTETCKSVLGTRKRQYKHWLTAVIINKIEKRKEVKQKLIQAKTRGQKRQLQLEYSEKQKEVKKCARRDKRRKMD